MIAVFTSAGFARLVTESQHSAEVAGKVLPRVEGLWRRAEKRADPRLGFVWFAYYFKPKPEAVAEWEDRWPRDAAGLRLPARKIQTDIAH